MALLFITEKERKKESKKGRKKEKKNQLSPKSHLSWSPL